MKSLRDFNEQEIFPKWYRDRDTSVLGEALKPLGIKNNFEGFAEVVHAAADLIHASQFSEHHFKNRLKQQYERYCTDNPNGPKLTVAKFDGYLLLLLLLLLLFLYFTSVKNIHKNYTYLFYIKLQ